MLTEEEKKDLKDKIESEKQRMQKQQVQRIQGSRLGNTLAYIALTILIYLILGFIILRRLSIIYTTTGIGGIIIFGLLVMFINWKKNKNSEKSTK